MALGELAAVGECRYGAFTFNETTLTKAVRVVPVLDASGRTTSYCAVTLTLTTLLAALDTSKVVRDAVRQLAKLKRQLP